MRSSAYPLPMLPRLSSMPARAKRTVRAVSSKTHAGHADERARGRDRLRRREPSLALEESPAAAERRARDVEGAGRACVQVAAAREQGEEVRVHRRRRLRGRAVHAAERARLAEYAELRFEPIRLVQRFARRRGVALVRAVEQDLEPAGHGGAVDAQPMVALFRRAPAGEQLPPRERPDRAGRSAVGRVGARRRNRGHVAV